MILLTRLNGVPFAVNADLIERVDSTPDTVVTMIDGRKYVVLESTDDVIERVVAFRASILTAADGTVPNRDVSPHARLRVVPGEEG